MPLDKPVAMPYCSGMTNKQFQRSVSADMNVLVRLQRERERREVCWTCCGTGRDMVGGVCVYCGGFGSIHVEARK